jgi:phosphonoacetaldehyde hydrolase
MPERIQAVILDWAGTVVDFGSRAPMDAFVRAFGQFGVEITTADARGPMGTPKREHIRAVGESPYVARMWQARHGRPFSEADVDAVFKVFEPLNVATVVDHAAPIPGAVDALTRLRARGIRLGSTTGYTRPIMEKLVPAAAAAGYRPEVVVCAGDLPAGRPSPLMMWHAMALMGVYPARTVVKVDDTPVGVAEGRAAGTWSVGVALTGNIAGLSPEELEALPPEERAALRQRAVEQMRAGGADVVIDSVADIEGAIAVLDARLAAGERPAIS